MTCAAFGKKQPLRYKKNTAFFVVLYTKCTVLNERSVYLFQCYYLDWKFEGLLMVSVGQ